MLRLFKKIKIANKRKRYFRQMQAKQIKNDYNIKGEIVKIISFLVKPHKILLKELRIKALPRQMKVLQNQLFTHNKYRQKRGIKARFK